MPYCTADCLCRHMIHAMLFSQLSGNLSICRCLTIRNLQQNLPHFLSECRSDRMKRRCKIRFFAGKIHIQPSFGLCKNRCFPHNMFIRKYVGKVFLPNNHNPVRPISSAANRYPPLVTDIDMYIPSFSSILLLLCLRFIISHSRNSSACYCPQIQTGHTAVRTKPPAILFKQLPVNLAVMINHTKSTLDSQIIIAEYIPAAADRKARSSPLSIHQFLSEKPVL